MAPSAKDLRILYQRSGNRCAFPNCVKRLEYDPDITPHPKALSEVAHIVADSPSGPRGAIPLPLDERDKLDNLILLCEEHHHLVDSFPETYTAERLHAMKKEHEALIDEFASRAVLSRQASLDDPSSRYVAETIHSTLLPVLEMPSYVFSVSCDLGEKDSNTVNKQVTYPPDSTEMWPFILRNKQLYTFQDLRRRNGPFSKIVGQRRVHMHKSVEWWESPDSLGWYVSLLNRSLNKLTGRKGLNFDREHNRYYFMPKEAGTTLEIAYMSLNQGAGRRQAVWQPITRATGEPKKYWHHLAISLRFHLVANMRWCLSLRPELHLTQDGKERYDSKRKGRKVTKRQSRRFNFDILGDLQFWRYFLSDGAPRILLNFGPGQRLTISSTLLESLISWPGIPEQHSKQFRNVEYQDDLFSLANYMRLSEADGWQEDDGEVEDESSE